MTLVKTSKSKLVRPVYVPLEWQRRFHASKARFRVCIVGRRGGKCLRKGTLVKTPTGSIPIEELQIGDTVYGYNKDGNIKPCKVIDTHYQGIKETVELKHSNRSLVWATEEHKFLTHYSNRSGKNKNVREQKTVGECIERNYNHITLAEEYCPIPGGEKSVTEAYALGALLGDGCSREAGVKFSTGDLEIVQGIAESLSCEHVKKSKGNNYTWEINRSFNYRGLKDEIPHYRDWLDKRYAHEKTCDLKTIRAWDRKSQLEFIAGLIDTDGSISKTRDGRLAIQLSMQAKKVLDVVAAILMDLFQAPVTWGKDNREKLINGPVWKLSILNNKFSKRILRELPTRVPRKQWKPEYEKYEERNSNPNYVGFKIGNRIKDYCYDITIDNDTNLYLLANGLITHNSYGSSNECAMYAERNPGSLVWWIGPSYNQATEVGLENFYKAFKPNSEIYDSMVKTVRKTHPVTIEFNNGSIIQFRSADKPKGLRGRGVNKLVCDEARFYDEEVWYDSLAPTLLDTGGDAAFISTPGSKNWLFDLYQLGLDPTEPDYESFHATSYENTAIPEKDRIAYLEEQKRNIPDFVFRREYLAEYLEDDSEVFRGLDKCIDRNLPVFTEGNKWISEGYQDGGQYIIGIDVAIHIDFTVFIVCKIENIDGQLVKRVVYMERLRKLEFEFQAHRLHAVWEQYGRPKIVVDKTGKGENFVNECHKYIYYGYFTEVVFSWKNKQSIILGLVAEIEQQRLIMPSFPVLEKELKQYGWEKTKDGNFTYSAPGKKHDDTVIALALAIYGAKDFSTIRTLNSYQRAFLLDM